MKDQDMLTMAAARADNILRQVEAAGSENDRLLNICYETVNLLKELKKHNIVNSEGEPLVWGCMEKNAPSRNPAANMDDGS